MDYDKNFEEEWLSWFDTEIRTPLKKMVRRHGGRFRSKRHNVKQGVYYLVDLSLGDAIMIKDLFNADFAYAFCFAASGSEIYAYDGIHISLAFWINEDFKTKDLSKYFEV